jgi:hypothetical protein
VNGETSLPAGTGLSIAVVTMLMHPTPKNYDWSYEISDGEGVVVWGAGGTNTFSRTVNTPGSMPDGIVLRSL